MLSVLGQALCATNPLSLAFGRFTLDATGLATLSDDHTVIGVRQVYLGTRQVYLPPCSIALCSAERGVPYSSRMEGSVCDGM